MHVSLMVAITADGKIARDVDHYPDWTGKADKKALDKALALAL